MMLKMTIYQPAYTYVGRPLIIIFFNPFMFRIIFYFASILETETGHVT